MVTIIIYICIFIQKTSDAQAIPHHLLTSVQPVPEQWLAAWSTLLSFIFFHVMSYGVDYSFSQFGSAFLVLFPHNSLCPPPAFSWARQQEKLRS